MRKPPHGSEARSTFFFFRKSLKPRLTRVSLTVIFRPSLENDRAFPLLGMARLLSSSLPCLKRNAAGLVLFIDNLVVW